MIGHSSKERIRWAMYFNGFTWPQLAARSGVAQKTLRRIKTGKRVRWSTAEKIAESLGLHPLPLVNNMVFLPGSRCEVLDDYRAEISSGFIVTKLAGFDLLPRIDRKLLVVMGFEKEFDFSHGESCTLTLYLGSATTPTCEINLENVVLLSASREICAEYVTVIVAADCPAMEIPKAR
jgi:transcriptional regulator with XRE-family HTH domain